MSDPKDEVIKKALTDPKFKAELLKDPKAAVEKALGVKVPAGTTIKIVEDSASTVHLVLPAGRASGELSEKELGRVAGGLKQWTSPGCCDNSMPTQKCG